jgi:hypothetical protein
MVSDSSKMFQGSYFEFKSAREQDLNGNGHQPTATVEPIPIRKLQLTRASDIKPKPVYWVWNKRIPRGKITLTPGKGGIGKSTFHTWIIAQLTRGELPGAYKGIPKSAIIVSSEDDWEDTIVPRLMANGADLSRVFRAELVSQTEEFGTLSLPRDIGELMQVIDEYDIALVSLDPLLSFVSSKIDTHKASSVRQALEPLKRLAEDKQIGLLGNAHFNKSVTGMDVSSGIMGSNAFNQVARSIISFARDPYADDGSCIISQEKASVGKLDLPNLRYRIDEVAVPTEEGPAMTAQFVMMGETDTSVSQIIADTDPEQKSEQEACRDFIEDYVSELGGVAKSKDVKAAAKNEGYKPATIDRAKKVSKLEHASEGMPRITIWYLPDTELGKKYAKEKPIKGLYGENKEDQA